MPPGGSVEPEDRFLLDTNIVIALFAGDVAVVAALRTAGAVFVPAVVLGELYFGARKSARSGENASRIAAFAAAVGVLPSDAATAVVYGELKAALHERGTPIPENDLWIAALARQHGLPLATRDAHFDALPGVGTRALVASKQYQTTAYRGIRLDRWRLDSRDANAHTAKSRHYPFAPSPFHAASTSASATRAVNAVGAGKT